MKDKPKVLHVIEAMGGGVFTYIVNLANGLSDDYDVTIAMGVRNETPEDYETYFNENINLIRVKSFSRSINPFKDVKSCFELRRIAKEVKPDIIHLHSSKAGAIGRMIFGNRKYKVFYTPHGYSFLMENINPLIRKAFKLVERICGLRGSTTIACGKGEWVESKAVSKRSTYVNNAIELGKLDNVMKNSDSTHSGEFTVYTAGRIEYQKNPELFNEVAKLLPDVRFVWIGEGSMKDCLTSENIEITGWKTSDEAIQLAMEGDVFILPSLWEGLPIALIEAMYMKKVCTVSNVVGNRDVVEHGVTGFICNTAQEFADAITKVKDGKASDIGENAHKLVKEEYNSQKFCESYKEIYRNN